MIDPKYIVINLVQHLNSIEELIEEKSKLNVDMMLKLQSRDIIDFEIKMLITNSKEEFIIDTLIYVDRRLGSGFELLGSE